MPAHSSFAFSSTPDQAAEPVAHREATAATSHGADPPAQSHCYFLLALSPSLDQVAEVFRNIRACAS